MDKTKQVYGSRVKVRPDKQETVTKNQIAVADQGGAKMDEGVIVAIGDKVEPGRFAIGQHVRFQRYGYEETIVDGQRYYYVEVGTDREDVLEEI